MQRLTVCMATQQQSTSYDTCFACFRSEFIDYHVIEFHHNHMKYLSFLTFVGDREKRVIYQVLYCRIKNGCLILS